MSRINLYWFRRDLRLEDNHGLFRALESGLPVLPVFIFDKIILDQLDSQADARVSFIYDEVLRLKTELEQTGSSLIVKCGIPSEVLSQLIQDYDVNAVYANHDYEPYAVKRDEEVRLLMEKCGTRFHTFKNQVIFEKSEVLKDDGNPYTVFTPYSKKWKGLFVINKVPQYPSENLKESYLKISPVGMESREIKPLLSDAFVFPTRDIEQAIISNYDKTRDFPSLEGTSRLGVHLRFGTVSIRRVAEMASRLNQVFLNELIWREFYMMILWHFPHVATRSFKPAYDRIPWKNDEQMFSAWCEGRTGYPIVDAGMRELNRTGYMHNRVRMITASFLTKHLLIDWRWGEAYFAKKLLDFELSSNNGGWQWAAGTGCDAAPYFRVFNPDLQTEKYDPDHIYIRRWVPEYLSPAYPKRIVEHAAARNEAISSYKKGILQPW